MYCTSMTKLTSWSVDMIHSHFAFLSMIFTIKVLLTIKLNVIFPNKCPPA